MRRAALLTLLSLVVTRAAGAAPVFNTKESGVRVTSAAIQALVDTIPATPPDQRAYYIRGSSEVYSAITSDGGLTFVEEPGVRLSSLTVPALDIAISSITGLSILPLDSAAGFRMLYSVIGTTGAYRIYTATSADGLAWANVSTPTVILNNGATFVGYPSLAELASGVWANYHVRNSVAGSSAVATNHVYAQFSADQGATWGAATLVVSTRASRVSATVLTDDRVRLYYTSPLVNGTSDTVVLSALSSNSGGSSFSLETGVRMSTAAGALHSLYVARATDTFRWRAYFGYDPAAVSTADAFSAVTDAPAPSAVSPSVVFNTNTGRRLVVTGDVFSQAVLPLLSLTMTGEIPIQGTAVASADDQTLTAAFDTKNATPGLWDVNVQNSNGQRTTLPQALLIDFPGGSVDTTDNLFRPLNGGAAKIDITTFNAGHITAKIYTSDGRFIQTLYDGERPVGTLTLTWNGTTAQGARVASGVYLVRIKGPKLDDTTKIIVIK